MEVTSLDDSTRSEHHHSRSHRSGIIHHTCCGARQVALLPISPHVPWQQANGLVLRKEVRGQCRQGSVHRQAGVEVQ